MSRLPPESTGRAVLGVGARELAWRGGCAAYEDAGTLEAAFAQALAGLRTGRRALGLGLGLDIVVGLDLACHWAQTPPQRTASLDELRRVALARRAHLFGGPADGWWMAADWHATRPFVCAAVPAQPCDTLHRLAAAAGLRARWATPWSLLAASPPAGLPTDGWCGLRGASRVLLWHCERGRVSHLLTLSAAAGESAEQVSRRASQSARVESLAAGMAADGTVRWLNQDAPTSEAAVALQMHPAMRRAPA